MIVRRNLKIVITHIMISKEVIW